MADPSNVNNPSDPKNMDTLLDEASKLIYGQRQSDYGDARKNFQDIADLWSVVLEIKVTIEQVILCMIQLKVARLCKSPEHRDSWVDVAGYVGCKGKVDRGE